MANGLPNDVIYGIVSDGDNNLWMSSNYGISMYNLTTKKITNYNEKDGLQGNEFNRNAFGKTTDNTIFFGGLNGFNYFNPRQLKIKAPNSSIVISEIKINYQQLDFKNNSSIISKPIYLTNEITLKHHQNDITIEFSSMDFTSLKNNNYQYKLDDYDANWIQSGNINKAVYTNLSPGKYQFMVKGTNYNGDWNAKPAILSITILAPWYLTWWFKIIMVVSILSFIYLLYSYRIKKFKEIQKIKNDISRDLHDDVGANLSTISIFAEIASSPFKSKKEVSDILEKIIQYTNTSQESMSDIIWMINSKEDTFLSLISRMQSIGKESLENIDTQLIFEYNEEIEVLRLTAKQLKSIYLIYKEAINNINKYARATIIKILIKKDKKNIVFTIKDNGVGFDPNNSNNTQFKNGNGLKNMKIRAIEMNGTLNINSRTIEGTSIILIFPL